MSTFGGRLRAARKQKGITQVELAKMLGIRIKERISTWERDVSLPDINMCVALCKALEIGTDYLLGYYDGTVQFSEKQKQIARTYGELDAHGRRMVETVVAIERDRFLQEQRKKADAGRLVRRSKVKPAEIVYLPCTRQAASAGTGVMLGSEDEMEMVGVVRSKETERADFMVPVLGDSMEPDFRDGDLLLVKKTEDLLPGQFGLFCLNGDGYVKMLGSGQLESLNPAYDPIPLDETSDLQVFGRIMGTARRPAGC